MPNLPRPGTPDGYEEPARRSGEVHPHVAGRPAGSADRLRRHAPGGLLHRAAMPRLGPKLRVRQDAGSRLSGYEDVAARRRWAVCVLDFG